MGVNVMNGVKETNQSADYGGTSGTSGKIGRGCVKGHRGGGESANVTSYKDVSPPSSTPQSPPKGP